MIIERREDQGTTLQLTKKEMGWLQTALTKASPEPVPDVPAAFIDVIVQYKPLEFEPPEGEEEPLL